MKMPSSETMSTVSAVPNDATTHARLAWRYAAAAEQSRSMPTFSGSGTFASIGGGMSRPIRTGSASSQCSAINRARASSRGGETELMTTCRRLGSGRSFHPCESQAGAASISSSVRRRDGRTRPSYHAAMPTRVLPMSISRALGGGPGRCTITLTARPPSYPMKVSGPGPDAPLAPAASSARRRPGRAPLSPATVPATTARPSARGRVL